jgi:hypothetical protein
VQLSPARLPRQAGGPAEKDYREWEQDVHKVVNGTNMSDYQQQKYLVFTERWYD